MKPKPETEQPEGLLIDPALIDVGPNIRSDVGEQTPEMDELVKSILANGLLEPIGVCKQADRYGLLFGFRRFCAWRRCRDDKIPVRVFPAPEDATASQILQFQENAHRVDLEPIEFADVLREIKRARNWSNNQISEHVHLTPVKVCRLLDLAGLSDDLKQHVRQGTLAVSTALELGKLSEAEGQALLPQALSGLLTRDQLVARRLTQRRGGTTPSPSSGVRLSKITIPLAQGTQVVVSGQDMSLAEVVDSLAECLAAARKGVKERLDSKTWQNVMRDKAQAVD